MELSSILNTSHTVALCVDEEDLAMSVGSGDLPVLATPRMIALMEEAAAALIAPHLDEGITSVGVRQNKVCWFDGDLYRIRMDSGYPVQHIRT